MGKMKQLRMSKEELGEAVSRLKCGEGIEGRFYWVGGVKWVTFAKHEDGNVFFCVGRNSHKSYAYVDIDTAWRALSEEHHLFPPKELVPIVIPKAERKASLMPTVECEEMRTVLTDAQAMKLATMMLYAADFDGGCLKLPEVHMEGRVNYEEENARKVAEAMQTLCEGIDIDTGQLQNRLFCFDSQMYVGEGAVGMIHTRFGTAPIYTDRRKRKVTLYRGVWVNGDSKKINAIYIDAYQPTGEHGDSERIDKAIMRQEREWERYIRGYRSPAKEQAYRDAERRIEDYELRKDTFCHGIGQRRVKLFLNRLTKAGDAVARMYRTALEIECVNLAAKKTLKKYHSDYHAYEKKEEMLRELMEVCKEQGAHYGQQRSTAPAATHVIYFELPGCEQISFHTNMHEAALLPAYDGEWDGKKCSTMMKLEVAIWTRYKQELREKYGIPFAPIIPLFHVSANKQFEQND